MDATTPIQGPDAPASLVGHIQVFHHGGDCYLSKVGSLSADDYRRYRTALEEAQAVAGYGGRCLVRAQSANRFFAAVGGIALRELPRVAGLSPAVMRLWLHLQLVAQPSEAGPRVLISTAGLAEMLQLGRRTVRSQLTVLATAGRIRQDQDRAIYLAEAVA